MKVQFYEETKFYNILKFSSERGREGEQNTRLNQERPEVAARLAPRLFCGGFSYPLISF